MASPRTRVELAFPGHFDRTPQGIVFAPGRLNLLGEHVDHQGGPVLPLPLRLGVAAAWATRPDRSVRVIALNAKQGDRFVLGAYGKSGRRWADLVRGVCRALEEEGLRLPGLDLVLAGDLPVGKGLGSSGAFLTAVVRAFDAARRDAPTPPATVAAVVMEAEAREGGTRCGPMDPYVAAVGVPGTPLLLDCARLVHEALPWPDGVEAVPIDSGVTRSLASTPYNERRAEFEEGLRRLQNARDLARAAGAPLDDHRLVERIPEPFGRRVRHVLSETRRVHDGAAALRRGDAETLGHLLDEGHRSLSRDAQTSTPELDAMAHALRQEDGVLGVRLQGAGFGGAFVILRRVGPPAPT